MSGFASVRMRTNKEKFSRLPEVVLQYGKQKRLSSGFIVVQYLRQSRFLTTGVIRESVLRKKTDSVDGLF